MRGILKNETNFSLQVLDADGKLHLLLRDEVREIQHEEKSLMPSDYDKQLAPDELKNLRRVFKPASQEQGNSMRVAFVLVCVASCAAAQVSYQRLLEGDARDWLTYQGPYHAQRHSLLDQIRTGNVSDLVPRWVFHVPGASRLESVPIVVDGVMYVTQPNEVYALDGRTGRLIWEYHHEPAIRKGPNRGVAVYGHKVFMGTPNAELVALDARTGSLVWKTKIAESAEGYWSPAAPLAIKDKIIAGIAPGDHGLNGFLDAYSPETGERLWRWHAIPRPGEPGNETWAGDSWKTAGGDTWLTGSYDPELNLIYWGIGNPAPDFDGDVRKGDNLYTESVVALDADTGSLEMVLPVHTA